MEDVKLELVENVQLEFVLKHQQHYQQMHNAMIIKVDVLQLEQDVYQQVFVKIL